MRISYTILFLCCLFGLKAQIIEVPSKINHLVFNEHKKEEIKKLNKIKNFEQQYNIPILEANVTDEEDILFFRENGIIKMSQTVIAAKSDIIVCADTSLLLGDFHHAQLLNDFNANVTLAGNCFQYFAHTHSILDTVSLLICDQYSICDTFVYQFRITQDTVGLPFFDDFSYDGPYPNSDLWLTKDVFVNNTLGKNPPSIGMATFDGLNAAGTPYGSTGYSDFLESTYLDLSAFNSGSNVYLSFYIQPKGYGHNPGETDSLTLEFKSVEGTWDTIAHYISDLPSFSEAPESFDFQAIKIEEDKYLHSGFQFRFKNVSSGTGVGDLWHLDYVKVNANESPDAVSPDIAFVHEASPILKKYSSMPWHQFKGFESEELNDQMNISLYNHFGFTETAEPSTVSIIEQNTGTIVLAESELLKLVGTENQKDVLPDTLIKHINPFPSFTSNMSNSSFDNEDELVFHTVYSFEQNEEALLTAGNNRVSRRTNFKNYFAYDDGTAESNLAAQGAGSQAAVKFTANVADSLKGVQMHIPHVFRDVSNQRFNLRVWLGNLDSDPVYERFSIAPFYVDSVFDTLQGFTSYRIEEPIYIPAGDFYIGWQQVNDEYEFAIPFGFDFNSPSDEQLIFMNVGNGWEPLPQRHQGALMIRAVVGEEAAIETLVEELEPSFDDYLNVFPNPTSGNIELILKEGELKNYKLQIYSLEGILRFEQSPAKKSTTLTLENGYYIVNLSKLDGSETLFKKLIISK